MKYHTKNNTILENIQPNVEMVEVFGVKSHSLNKIQHQHEHEQKSRSTASFHSRKIRQRDLNEKFKKRQKDERQTLV